MLALLEWLSQQKTPVDIWKLLRTDRRARHVKPLCLTAVRKALRGATHRGASETRGAKATLSGRAVIALNKKRRELVSKSWGARQVTWKEVIKKSRVKKIHPTTAKRSLIRAGYAVASRANRQKPERSPEHIAERLKICRRWKPLPKNYFASKIDLIIDNKMFQVPTTDMARRYKAKIGVHSQIRTRSEGLEPQYTKPNVKRNRMNLGGSLKVAAGIRRDRVVLWKYLEGQWSGDAAATLYKKDIKQVFKRLCPAKASPSILEDNDPTGYKSSKAKAVKKLLKYKIVSLPRYSPDLNPMDFFLWADIEKRMMQSAPKAGNEKVEEYKRRLRKTAMATSKRTIRRALASMPKRIAAVVEAKGNHISID